jgi:hypothetical protein
MAKRAIRLGGLLEPGNRAEELERAEKQLIVLVILRVIRVDLAQTDLSEAPRPRDRQRLRSVPAAEVAVVLGSVDFRTMKTWHPRRLVCSHDLSPAVRKSGLRTMLRPSATSTPLSAERVRSDDFGWPRELDALTLLTVAKAGDFPLQAYKDFARI